MANVSVPRGLVTGQTTGGVLPITAGRQIRDVASEISLLDVNNTALITLLMKLRKEKCNNPKFEWQYDEFPAQKTTINGVGESSSGDVTMTVDDGTVFRPGDMIWVPETDEVMYVESVSTHDLVVVRGIGGTVPIPFEDGAEVYYIGNAQPMGWQARPPLTTQVTQPFNYTQLFKESIEVTGTLDATSLYGGKDMTYQIRKHGELHKKDIERTFWWGARDLIDSSEADVLITLANGGQTAAYMTRGVLRWMNDSYVHTNASDLTEDEFTTYLETDFRYGNGVKFMFCSPRALSVISGWGRDKLQVVPRDTTFGINITRYTSPHGELNLINNKLFQDVADTDAAVDPSTCSVILDIEQLKYRYLRDTTLEMNIEEPDRDSKENQYMTECGLQMDRPKHHAVIYGWKIA